MNTIHISVICIFTLYLCQTENGTTVSSVKHASTQSLGQISSFSHASSIFYIGENFTLGRDPKSPPVDKITLFPEAVIRRCSVKNMFLEISQNSHENTCARDSFLIKLQTSGLELFYKRV